jgi:hypothetical protein
MIKKAMAPLIWAAILALLLGGAFLIVARNGPTAQGEAPAAYSH